MRIDNYISNLSYKSSTIYFRYDSIIMSDFYSL